MRKRVSTLRKLIVVNGFKHFIMILLVSWDTVSKTTVHKYMNRELQLYSICRRKRPAYHRGLAHKIFPNLWKRNFSPEWPNRVWCTDFTYMTLTNGTMRYHCSIIDLYDRSVVAGETARLSQVPWPCGRLKKRCQVQRLPHRTWFCTRIKEVSLLPQSLYNIAGNSEFLKAWAVRAVRMTMRRWNAITIP